MFLNIISPKNFTVYGILILSHFSYKLIQTTFQLSFFETTILLTVFNFFFFYWVTAIGFEILDQNFSNLKKKYKYKEINSKYSFKEMIPTILRNQFIQIFLVIWILSKTHSEDFNSSGVSTFISNVMFYFVIDLFFGGGHYILHFQTLYKPTHSLHHSTFSSQGVSAHFMTLIDFSFESMLASIIMCVGLYFGASPISLVSMAAVGSYQTIVDHSGWNLPLNKDPIHHYLHHNYRKKIVNYGLGPIEQLLGIWVEPNGLEEKKKFVEFYQK
jgi:sterol desaturase/sphingolipid hydroxylase (fatty acid hydroxylase superfamily)